jgi:hypothetical protein
MSEPPFLLQSADAAAHSPPDAAINIVVGTNKNPPGHVNLDLRKTSRVAKETI